MFDQDNQNQVPFTPPPVPSGEPMPMSPMDIPPITSSGVTTPPNEGGKKFGTGKIIATIFGIFLLVGGMAAGLILVRRSQDVREKASSACSEECPGVDVGGRSILRNCTPPDTDGSAQESLCNIAGRTQTCGGNQYCCPSIGGIWTTNLSACTPREQICNDTLDNDNDGLSDCRDSDCTTSTYCQTTPTPTATISATLTATPSGTRTITSTPSSTLTVSPPIPESGIPFPTFFSLSLGVILVIISLALAL